MDEILRRFRTIKIRSESAVSCSNTALHSTFVLYRQQSIVGRADEQVDAAASTVFRYMLVREKRAESATWVHEITMNAP